MTVEARQLGTDFGYPSSQGEERPEAGISGGPRSGACRISVGASLYAAGAAAIRGFPDHGLRDGRGTKNLWSALETKWGFSNFCVATRKVASGCLMGPD